MSRALISTFFLLQLTFLRSFAAVIPTNGVKVQPPSLNWITGFQVDYVGGQNSVDEITVFKLLIDALVHFSWQGNEGVEKAQEFKINDEDDTYLYMRGINDDETDTSLERRFLIEALFQITGYFTRGAPVTDATTALEFNGDYKGFILIIGPDTPRPPPDTFSRLRPANALPIPYQHVRSVSGVDDSAPQPDFANIEAAVLPTSEQGIGTTSSPQSGHNTSSSDSLGGNRDIWIQWHRDNVRKEDLFYSLAGGLATIAKFPVVSRAVYMPLRCDDSPLVLRIVPSTEVPDPRMTFTFGNANDAMATIMEQSTGQSRYRELYAMVDFKGFGPHSKKNVGIVEILKVSDGVQASEGTIEVLKD